MIKQFCSNFEMDHLVMLSTYQFDLLGICRGDSGAPLWKSEIVRSPIKNQPCYKKNTLVGVMSGSIESINEFEPPCSSFASRAHKITKEVLAWIRKNMQRYDSE